MFSHFSGASWLKTCCLLQGVFEPRHFSSVIEGSKGILSLMPLAAPVDPFLSTNIGQNANRTQYKTPSMLVPNQLFKCQYNYTTVYRSIEVLEHTTRVSKHPRGNFCSTLKHRFSETNTAVPHLEWCKQHIQPERRDNRFLLKKKKSIWG